MNSIDFCYWLQGVFEVGGVRELSEAQTTIIKNHLNLVFTHEIDPMREKQTTAAKSHLDAAHSPLDPNVKYRC